MKNEDPTLWPVFSKVRVVKLAAAEDAEYPSCSWEDWKTGEFNEGSPPVDYELRGLLFSPLKIGHPIVVVRNDRSDLKGEGIFVSTPVREFKNGAAITMNSIYFITFLKRPLTL